MNQQTSSTHPTESPQTKPKTAPEIKDDHQDEQLDEDVERISRFVWDSSDIVIDEEGVDK